MKYLTVLIFLSSLFSNGQSVLNEYKANNGYTYKVGDNLQLNMGSGCNGDFVYCTIGGLTLALDGTGNNQLPAANAGLIVKIKKIKHYRSRHVDKIMFVVGGGNITNYNIDIKYALLKGEVDPIIYMEEIDTFPETVFETKEDELDYLKRKLDNNEITNAEYFELKRQVLLKYKDD